MKKKALSLVLAVVMAAALFAVPSLADADDATAYADVLYSIGLFQGTGVDSAGDPIYELDRAPTRAEAVTMLVRLIGKEAEALAGTWTTPFTDVADWAKPYVGYAYANGLTDGVSGTQFGSAASVSASQYLTFVLRALGYESGTDFAWDSAWTLSDDLGITDGEYNEATSNFTRGDVAAISFYSLYAYMKNEDITLADSLRYAGVFDGLDVVWFDCILYGYEPDAAAFLFCYATFSPARYNSFKIDSVAANGLPCTVTEINDISLIAEYDPALAYVLEGIGAFSLVLVEFDEEAVLAASTESYYSPEDGKTYPIIVFEWDYTAVLPSGEYEEAIPFTYSIYYNGYSQG